MGTGKGLIAAVFAILLSAQNAHADTTDDYVAAQMRDQAIPGLSLAVLRDGRVVKTAGYGFANVELRAPASSATVYELCSITKQFVAVAILLLVEDGKLRLDDPISQYFSNAPESWRGITVRHLLSHTSGIRDLINDPLTPGARPLDQTRAFPREDTTATDVIRQMMTAELNFAPGSRWSYSNTGYIVLAELVSRVSGTPWHQFLADRVFRPLGMNDTRFHDESGIIPDRAARYDRVGTPGPPQLRNSPYLNPTYWWLGGAGIMSSARDMAKWDLALSRGAILTPASLELLRRPGILTDGSRTGYGFGWNLDQYQSQSRMWHNGSISGGSSHYSRFLDSRTSVIVLANTNANLDVIALAVAGFYDTKLAHSSPILSVAAPARAEAGKPLEITVSAQNWGVAIPKGQLNLEIRAAPFGPDNHVNQQSSAVANWLSGRTLSRAFSWTPPAPGEYRLYIGAFNKDWSVMHAWKNGVATIDIR